MSGPYLTPDDYDDALDAIDETRPLWLLGDAAFKAFRERVGRGDVDAADAIRLLAFVDRQHAMLETAEDAHAAGVASVEFALAETKRTGDENADLIADHKRLASMLHWSAEAVRMGLDAILDKAENYVETKVEWRGEKILVTFQKKNGLSPADKNAALMAHAETLAKQLDDARDALAKATGEQ